MRYLYVLFVFLISINSAHSAIIGTINHFDYGAEPLTQVSMGVCTTAITNTNFDGTDLPCDGGQITDPQPTNMFVTNVSLDMGPTFSFTVDLSTNPEFATVAATLTNGLINAITFSIEQPSGTSSLTGYESTFFYGDFTAADLVGNTLTHYDVNFSNIIAIDQFGGFTYDIEVIFHGNPVPIPAATWLFGSGLIGLIGVARRKKV